MILSPLISAAASFAELADVATVAITSIGPQESGGNVPVSYTIDQDDTVEAVLFLATDPDPSASDFNTGASSGYIDLGAVALTVGGTSIALSGPDNLLDNYKLAFLPSGGGDADVAVSSSFALDSTALTLSTTTPTDDATGVSPTAQLIANFDDDVAATGTMTLRLVGGAAVETFTLSAGTGDNGGTAVISGSQVTLTPGASMSTVAHCVRTSGMTDTNANPLTDIADDTTWNFTVAAPSATIATIVSGASGDRSWIDTSAIAGTLYEETEGFSPTTEISADGDAVGTAVAAAGTINGVAEFPSSSPFWRATPGTLVKDPTGQYLRFTESVGWTSDMYVAFVVEPIGTNGLALMGGETGSYVGLGLSGNTGTTVISGAGSPTVKIDGVTQSFADRGAVYTAINGDADPKVVEIIGADMTGADWATFTIGSYPPSSTFYSSNGVGYFVILPTPSSGDQTTIYNELATIRDAI